MVKVVYYKSLGRKKYRKYWRYYYRKSKKLANRATSNYYKAKITLELAVWHQNNAQGNQGADWVLGTVSWNQVFQQGFIFANQLRADAEYQWYINLYDQVQLLGTFIQAYPSAKNTSNLTSHAPITLQYKHDGLTSYGGGMFLNPIGYSKKYFKNIDRRWLPISQSEGNVGNDQGVPGMIIVNQVNDTATQASSPAWNLFITIYLKFKKNKNM